MEKYSMSNEAQQSDQRHSPDKQRGSSPTPSNVSMKSDHSMSHPPDLNNEKSDDGPNPDRQRGSSPIPSNVSMKSDHSKSHPPDLNNEKSDDSPDKQRGSSPIPSNVSMKSDHSMSHPPDLNNEKSDDGPNPDKQRGSSPTLSNVSMKSDHSKSHPPDLNNEKSDDSMKQKPKQAEPANNATHAKKELTKHLKSMVLATHDKTQHKEIETDLFVIKTGKQEGGENQSGSDQERTLIKHNEIFKSKSKITKMLTIGLDHIGKTFQAREFMYEWANGISHKNIDMLFFIDLGELSSTKIQSLEDLLDNLGNASEHRKSKYEEYKIVFVLDSLDKYKLPLDFCLQNDLTDTREKASVEKLLINLIKGNLLPSAYLWILTRHSAADKIPPEYIDQVTECQDSVKRRQKLTRIMKKWFTNDFPFYEDTTHPHQMNTEHIVKEHGDALKKVEAISVADIFKPEKSQPIRTVLTIGEACIGKTFHAHKFTREWATSTSSTTLFTRLWNFATRKQPDEEMLFYLTFHQLSDLMEEKLSLVGLLNHFFRDTQDCVVSDFEKYALVIVLDGLDQHLLNFNHDVETLSDVRKVAPVNMLLTNLIMGNLLPSAHLWILSRPLAAQQIPPEYVHRQTEIREKPDFASQRKLKARLIKQCQRVSEGTSQQGKSALLNDIYTDVHIIEGESEDAIGQNKSAASCESVTQDTPIKLDLFKFGQKGEIRNVLTNGIAGIGKTIVLQKNMLNWAEGVINQDIYFVFTFPFRHLNLMAAKDHSFEELINCFFPEMKTSEITNYDQYKILIVLDGLDECRLDLNFIECEDWSDTKKPAPLNVLLTNLIKGNLLPGAQLWITARPASSRNIPSLYINLVTEVCGFTDDQKKQYFEKRYSQKLAESILSHIKMSRALYVMCCIPVFCWITSTVLEDFLLVEQEVPKPKTLTDMYIGFLLLQCKLNINKYQGVDETKGDIQVMDLYWTEKNKETVLSLGKLAYEELERDNLVFREEDLKQRAMDVTECAVYSGLFTQISQESYDLLKQNLYSFVHLSIQEFLAAVYAFVTFVNTGVNVLTKPASTVRDQPASDFYICAVDKALENPNGHWDMFLRFLLGISQETNQKPLQALLVSQSGGNQPETNKDTIKYIKNKIKEDIDANKSINLFHCLNELNDHSLVKDIQDDLKKKKHDFKKFTRSQWSALTFVLLTSDADLDVFDLNNYFKSEEVLLGMLPVVKVSRTALLSWSDLTAKSCASLASSILTSSSSNLTVLDLSHNDIKDTGVEKLAEGLKSKCCRLEILKLIGCQVTNTGCLSLASALEFNPLCLQELDLSYNHPGESGKQKLSAIASLKKLRMDHGGECRLKPGLKKYGVELTLDVNTASKKLLLSDAGRTARRRELNDKEAHYPEHDDRFLRTQVLCEEELTGFCYWEVEWHGHVGVAVVDGQINRKGWDSLSGFGTNKKSWNLVVSRNKNTLRYKAWSGSKTITPQCHELGLSTTHPKLGMFLDRDGGTLNFYDVSSEKPRHIHTFKDLKGFKLYAGFWFKKGHVSLCKI